MRRFHPRSTSIGARRSALRALIATVVCSTAAQAAPVARAPVPVRIAGTAASAEDNLITEVEGLLVSWSEDDTAGEAALVDRLTRYGSPVAAPCFELLVRGSLGLDEEGEPVPLALSRQRVLRAVLGELPREVLADFLRARWNETESGARERLVAMELLAVHGGAAEVGLLLELVTPADPEERIHFADGRALRQALADLLTRDPEAFESLRETWSELHRASEALVIRAVGAAGRGDGLLLATWALGLEDARVSLILAEVGQLAAVAEGRTPPGLLAHVRRALVDEDRAVRQAAALTVARLGDLESIPTLIDLLWEGGLRREGNAHWALRQLTGEDFGTDVQRWTAWYEAEEAWFFAEAPAVFELLTSSDPEQVVAAVREVSKHRLHPEERAYELAFLADHPRRGVRELTCATLRDIGSWQAVPALVDALELRDGSSNPPAAAALVAITGHELPPEPEAWAEIRRGASSW